MTYGNEQNISRLQEARDKNLAITEAKMQARRDFENGVKPVDYTSAEPYQYDMQKAYDTERAFLVFKARNAKPVFDGLGLSKTFQTYLG